MQHSIKQRLKAGKQVNIFSVGAIPSTKIIEIVGMIGGYHGIWVDEEHAGLTQSDFEILALACRSVGLDSYVRVAPVDYATIMRPMEAGIGGIMAAQVRSVDEVQKIVSWFKFPPHGQRGLNPSNFEGNYTTLSLAEIVRRGNEDRWLSVQIETAEALECVEQIAAVEGVEHLFVGPSDLSVSLGVPGQFMHERCTAALQRISAAVKLAGKSWGILARSQEHAQFCKSLGCQLFAVGNDLASVLNGVRTLQGNFPAVFADSASAS